MAGTVLITGASRGIGLGCAQACLAHGWKVAAAGSTRDSAEAGVAALIEAAGADAAARVTPVALEVAEAEAWGPALDAAEAALGPVDALIANAGVSPRRDGRKIPFAEEGDEAFWARTMAVNVDGVVFGARAVARRLKARGAPGSIVAMSSIAGQVGIPLVSSYYATSKAALLGFVRAAAYDLGPHGIRINAIGPGRIATDMVAASGQAANDAIAAETALGRLGRPEELGEAAEFLISDRASFVTGTCLNVTGGWVEV
ncbi:MAG: SDR family NAD(P)-dependent oxidoreductase [Pseudomonadota bacterium]